MSDDTVVVMPCVECKRTIYSSESWIHNDPDARWTYEIIGLCLECQEYFCFEED